MSPRAASFLTPLAAMALLGCSSKSPMAGSSPEAAEGNFSVRTSGASQAPQATPPMAPEPRKAAAANADVIERKIIYSGQLTIVVKQLDDVVAEVERLLDEYKGYIAKSEILGHTGTRRTATFTVRVPADSFRKFKAALTALGIPVKNSSDSRDVTEEFIDVQARISNLKVEEKKLNELLDKAASRLDEILRLRPEIAKIRGEIEQAEGRLKHLAALTSLSTIELTLKEVQGDYKPPSPDSPVEPNFKDRVSTTFDDSVGRLRRFGETTAVWGVGIAPWLPLIIPLMLVMYFGSRRLVRTNGEPAAAKPKPAPAKRPERKEPPGEKPAE